MNGSNLGEYSAEALIASTEYETEFDNSQPIAVGRLMFEIKYHCPRLGIDFGLWDAMVRASRTTAPSSDDRCPKQLRHRDLHQRH